MLEGYAGFVLPRLEPGMRVVDVGCGRGAITLSLGSAAHPIHVLGVAADTGDLAHARKAAEQARVSTVDFVAASPDGIPLATSSVDVVFSHGLLEHVADPQAVLAECARVLRPGGTLAVSTSDWSKAKLRPKTANVDAALRGRHLLHRRAGGNPFAGRHVTDWVLRAGFRDVRSKTKHHPGPAYRELAEQVETELAAAIRSQDGSADQQLASAARSAWMWVRDGSGEFAQCWTEVLATR
ncbi:class I SAM-dependent methyltransferase [Prauserella cavernicola]|uniref:Methyltransferase domain-containing protein n=1 Tax=Prauserella cavernicola TaxID=2800127 RepID=A0A934QRV1_9PSEU|nr:methyltransferase domain-containing protein [Prauserella cavernicola]MBK1785056.1 methyltransferase domain-containing protein [Prauserella cavernicola]